MVASPYGSVCCAALFFADGANAAPPSNACSGGAGCAGSSCPSSVTSAQAAAPVDACPAHGENQNAVDIFPGTNSSPSTGRLRRPACPTPPSRSSTSSSSIRGRSSGRRRCRPTTSSSHPDGAAGGVVQRQIARGFVRQTADRSVAHGADGGAAAKPGASCERHLPADRCHRRRRRGDGSGRPLAALSAADEPGRIYRDPQQQLVQARRAQRDQDADAADRLDRIQIGMENPQRQRN